MAKKSENFNLILIIAIALSLIIFFYCLQSTTIKEGKKTRRQKRTNYKNKESRKKGTKLYRGGQELLSDNGECEHTISGGRDLCDYIGYKGKKGNAVGRYNYKEPKSGKCHKDYPYQNKCHPIKDYKNKCVKKKIKNQFCNAKNGTLNDGTEYNLSYFSQYSLDRDNIKFDGLTKPIPYINVETDEDGNEKVRCKSGYARFDNNMNDEIHSLKNILRGRKYRKKAENRIWGKYNEPTVNKSYMQNHLPELYGRCYKHKDFKDICKSIELKEKKYNDEDSEYNILVGDWKTKFVPGRNRNCITKWQDAKQARSVGAVVGSVAAAAAAVASGAGLALAGSSMVLMR